MPPFPSKLKTNRSGRKLFNFLKRIWDEHAYLKENRVVNTKAGPTIYPCFLLMLFGTIYLNFHEDRTIVRITILSTRSLWAAFLEASPPPLRRLLSATNLVPGNKLYTSLQIRK